MMRRMHAHHREQDNHRFFVPYRIAVRNHLRPADPNANITFRFVNHNGTVLGLPGYSYVPGLATGKEVTLVALDPTNQRLSWHVRSRTTGLPRLRNAGTYRLLRSYFRMTCYPGKGRTSPSTPLPNRVTCCFFTGPCTGGSSWARLNITRGPTTSKLIQNKQLEFWKLFKVFSQLKLHTKSKKAAILFELPKACEYWNDERLKKQIKNGESHEFDGRRYGLKQRYAKKPLPIRKPWRVISWNFDLGESFSKKCNGNHSHGPCAGRETKDTLSYTSLIVNVILRRFAARAKFSRHHGVNLTSPCIFKGFVEKKELQGGRSSTSTSPSTLRTNCSFVSASQRGEQGECWLHIALGLPVERWWSCTPPGSGKSGLTVEGWRSCTSPGQGSPE